jgi:hypothetical protein
MEGHMEEEGPHQEEEGKSAGLLVRYVMETVYRDLKRGCEALPNKQQALACVKVTSLTYSLTHLLPYLLTYLLTHLVTYSLTYSLTHSLPYLLTHSLPYLLTHSLTS